MKNFFKFIFVVGILAMVVIAVGRPTSNTSYNSYENYSNKSQTYNTANTWNTTNVSNVTNTQTVTKQNVETVVDSRVANYTGTVSDYRQREYKWVTVDGRYTFTITLNLDYNVYKYYHSLDRYYEVKDFDQYYIDDYYSKQAVEVIVENLKSLQKQAGYSDAQIVAEAVNFVQSNITYQYDIDGTGQSEYPKYPLETLFEKAGDCEDSAMLLASIIEEMGYGTALLHYPGKHLAVGILGDSTMTGSYYNFNGKNYFYTEPTATGWAIGQIPNEYKNVSCNLYVLKHN